MTAVEYVDWYDSFGTGESSLELAVDYTYKDQSLDFMNEM